MIYFIVTEFPSPGQWLTPAMRKCGEVQSNRCNSHKNVSLCDRQREFYLPTYSKWLRIPNAWLAPITSAVETIHMGVLEVNENSPN